MWRYIDSVFSEDTIILNAHLVSSWKIQLGIRNRELTGSSLLREIQNSGVHRTCSCLLLELVCSYRCILPIVTPSTSVNVGVSGNGNQLRVYIEFVWVKYWFGGFVVCQHKKISTMQVLVEFFDFKNYG